MVLRFKGKTRYCSERRIWRCSSSRQKHGSKAHWGRGWDLTALRRAVMAESRHLFYSVCTLPFHDLRSRPRRLIPPSGMLRLLFPRSLTRWTRRWNSPCKCSSGLKGFSKADLGFRLQWKRLTWENETQLLFLTTFHKNRIFPHVRMQHLLSLQIPQSKSQPIIVTCDSEQGTKTCHWFALEFHSVFRQPS